MSPWKRTDWKRNESDLMPTTEGSLAGTSAAESVSFERFLGLVLWSLFIAVLLWIGRI